MDRMKIFTRYNLLILMVMATLCLWPSWVRASEVELQVKVIYASKHGQEVDKRVDSIIERLNKLFDFSSYKLLGEHREKSPLYKAKTFPLPDGRRLDLTLVGKDENERHKLKLEIPGLLSTDFRLKNGASLILGGPRHKKGVLILVIQANESQ